MEITNQSEMLFDPKEIEIFLKEKGRLGYRQELVDVSLTEDKKFRLKFSSTHNEGIDTLFGFMIDVEAQASAWLGYPLKKASSEMSVRLYNTLTASGVKCFAELTEEKVIKLIKSKDFGKLTFRELETTIKKLGGNLNSRVYDLAYEYKPSIVNS